MTEPALRPPPAVTVAIPLYNEAEAVFDLLEEVSGVLAALPDQVGHEILCIDDGSTDQTIDILIKMRERHPELRVVSLSRNFGHQAALSAALDYAEGDVVFIIDGDLQDDPGVLPIFLDEYREGAEVVYATRSHRPEGRVLKTAYSLHYRLLNVLSDTPMPVDSGDFSLLSRKAVDLIRGLPERHRYLRGMRAWIGLRQVGIDVSRRERVVGESKYSTMDLFGLAMDGVFSFSVVPLRIASVLGGLTVVGGLLYGVYVLIDRLTGGPPQGFATLALLQIIFSGMVLLVLGIVGEYVGRIYREVKQRPVYVVAEEWKAQDRG